MMPNIDKSEQWRLEGNCQLCRRRNYCSKRCAACMNSMEKNVKSTLGSILIKRIFGGN